MADALKLAAEDADDLIALSALVQDAVLRVGDMAFLPKARRFALVLNRYRWEAGDARGRGERVRAGLRIEEVAAARATRIRQDAKDAVLSLLSLTFTPAAPETGAAGGGTLTLTFAGGGAIALQIEALEVHLDDLAGPWPAKARPAHDLD
jgi:hypothetical protein